MAVYVDDNCLMGPCRERVDAEIAPLAPQALETGDFGIVEPIL